MFNDNLCKAWITLTSLSLLGTRRGFYGSILIGRGILRGLFSGVVLDDPLGGVGIGGAPCAPGAGGGGGAAPPVWGKPWLVSEFGPATTAPGGGVMCCEVIFESPVCEDDPGVTLSDFPWADETGLGTENLVSEVEQAEI